MAREVSPRFVSSRILIGLLVAALLVMLPVCLQQWDSEYYIYLASKVIIWSLFAMSFNLVLGCGGMMSFGHAAFYGLGAYTCALLLVKASWPMPVAFIAAALIAALAGVIIGFFSVRIMGMFYFAVLTLSFSQLIYIIVFKWRSLTLGDDGIQGIPVPALISTLASYAPFYYFALAVAAISIFIMWKITKSPFGMILRSARENPDRASFIGVDLRRYRLAAFTISAFFSGVAGVLFVLMETSVSPDVLKWSVSGEVILMGLLGGMHVFPGPMVGAAIMVLLNSFLTSYTEYWALFIGSILILSVLFFPQGVAGIAYEAWQKFIRRSQS
ncbi:MAG: branched-chain amino acid ABC transporter permease [Desulfomonilaceae bacterium]